MSKNIDKSVLISPNGDQAVKLLTKSEYDIQTAKLQDLSTVERSFAQDQSKHHLGLLRTFDSLGALMGKTSYVPKYLEDILTKGAVIELEGTDSFTYTTPISTQFTLEVAEDTTEAEVGSSPGLAGSTFPLKLNRPMKHGDRITYDIYAGIQLFVSEKPIQESGGVYTHYVRMWGNTETVAFPLDKLKKGTQYTKIGANMGEFSTHYSSLHATSGTGEMLHTFQLHNHMGIEVETTLYASRKKVNNILDSSLFFQSVQEDMRTLSIRAGKEYDVLLTSKVAGVANNNGTPKLGISKKDTFVMPLFEALSLAELTRMEMTSNVYSTGGEVPDENGGIKSNEGFYTQLRKGNVISYAVPGGFSISDLQSLSDQIFRYCPTITDDARRFTIWAGKGLYDNIANIKQVYGLNKLSSPMYVNMQGTAPKLPSALVSGDLNNLVVNNFKITSVNLEGVGWVDARHDETLDFSFGKDRFSNKLSLSNGEDIGTYSGYLDIRDTSATNAFTDPNLRNAINLGGESALKSSSVFYVRPKRSLHWGWTVGRMNTYSDVDSLWHFSSTREMSTSFWAHVQSAVVILDKSGTFLIELERPKVTRIV